ncbi:MAG TPA: FAD-dependent oxidoreductase [Acidimicrobiia bacterium]|nr:FAD-dependent oxidoreductase [Acidimicrobiia bacterium]
MNEFVERDVKLVWRELKDAYDVVIIGGGGHGLSTAYHLATRHGISNVAVLERGYVGSGNTGRNTTVIRANYGIPESIRFYQHSVDLYRRLEEETGRWIMHEEKGLIWLVHSEMGIRGEKQRAVRNSASGADTIFLTRSEVGRLVPELDLDGGGSGYPVLGASFHPRAATARHDRVVWALAEGAMARGVTVAQRTTVTGIRMEGDRVTGVETDRGPISAGVVVSAVGGHVTTIADMVGLRLPVVTHPLQAYVTNHYEKDFPFILGSVEIPFYLSQTARGEMLIGGEYETAPGYSYGTTFDLLATCSARAIAYLPFLRDLRILRQWAGVCDLTPDASPIMGLTPVEGFLVTTGWGTWGFKAIPAGGEQMAELIATGRTPELIAPFSYDRFRRDRLMADAGSTGTH